AIWRGVRLPKTSLLPGGAISWTLQGAADPYVFSADYDRSDRPEVYACPFTGYLFLTASFYVSANAPDPKPDQHAIRLLDSTDKGKTGAMGAPGPAGDGCAQMVMPSPPNGRLFLYHGVDQQASGFDPRRYYGELFCSTLFNPGETPTTPRVLPAASGQVI